MFYLKVIPILIGLAITRTWPGIAGYAAIAGVLTYRQWSLGREDAPIITLAVALVIWCAIWWLSAFAWHRVTKRMPPERPRRMSEDEPFTLDDD